VFHLLVGRKPPALKHAVPRRLASLLQSVFLRGIMYTLKIIIPLLIILVSPRRLSRILNRASVKIDYVRHGPLLRQSGILLTLNPFMRVSILSFSSCPSTLAPSQWLFT